jgi:meso-butanediol dehydrogenase / (S,S)-butanediol dehydrogenase / diacetyl reductase
VVGLTQAVTLELAPYGTLVNAVCPGFVTTPMQERELALDAGLRGVDAEAVRQLWIDATPFGRLEAPVDVPRLVPFPASVDARFVTGESVAVNGAAYTD